MFFLGFPLSAFCLTISVRVHVFFGWEAVVLGLTVGISMLKPKLISIEGFMEPKFYAFRFGAWTPLAHQLRIWPNWCLGSRSLVFHKQIFVISICEELVYLFNQLEFQDLKKTAVSKLWVSRCFSRHTQCVCFIWPQSIIMHINIWYHTFIYLNICRYCLYIHALFHHGHIDIYNFIF